MAGGGHNNRRWRLSHTQGPHVDQVRNDINVTPLVDVMLVLLIIFMLMVLVMGRGQDVDVPKARNVNEEKDKQQPVVAIASADDDYALYVEKKKIPPGPNQMKAMREAIEAQWKSPTTVQAGGVNLVFLKVDTTVTYDKVYPILKYLNHEMNVEQVDVAVAKAGEK